MPGTSFSSKFADRRIWRIVAIPFSILLVGFIVGVALPFPPEVPLTQVIEESLNAQMLGRVAEFYSPVEVPNGVSLRPDSPAELFDQRDVSAEPRQPVAGPVSRASGSQILPVSLPVSHPGPDVAVTVAVSEPKIQLVSHPVSDDPTPTPNAAPVRPLIPRLIPALTPESVSVQPIPISLTRVDTLILSGNFPFAAELLNEFERLSSGLVKTQIRFRRGLCAELLGDPQGALGHYRSLAESHQSTAISDAATLASARTLMEAGHREIGHTMLLRLLLSRERSMNKDVRGDVVHTLAASLLPNGRPESLLQESEWLTRIRKPTPEELLRSWDALGTGSSPRRAQDQLSVRRLTTSPQGILVTMRSGALEVSQILNKLTSELNWSFTAGIETERMLRDRTVAVDFGELPLDVLLDALLIPHSVRWTYDSQQLSISAAPVQARRIQTPTKSQSASEAQSENSAEHDPFLIAERFLQLAVSIAPEHPATPLSYVLLGTAAAETGDLDRAINFFEMSIDLFPRSTSVGTATFNLGKACLYQGQREEALKYFYRTIDHVSGVKTDGVAYLYIGRILLENDTPREAIGPLMRGLPMLEGSEYEAPATLLLAAAYLMNGNATAANSVLLEHRAAFEATPKQSPDDDARLQQMAQQAAFLSSLARFWGTEGTQRIREGRALLATLTHAKVDTMFGRHSAFLVGVAFAAVGLSTEQEAIFRHSLAEPHPFPLQKRMRLLLTGELVSENSLQRGLPAEFLDNAAVTQPGQTDAEGRTSPATDRARLLQAELDYRDGKYEDVMKSCRLLLQASQFANGSSPDEPVSEQAIQFRKATLRLMGLVYQAQGQHQQAIRCFAGIPPLSGDDQDRKDQL